MSRVPTIILFSTADWDNPFWTNKQHMANHLARQGFRVLYVESLGMRKPTMKSSDLLRIWKRVLRLFKSVRRVDKNIWVFSPFILPFHSVPLVRTLNSMILRLSFFFLEHLIGGGPRWIWTYHPLVIDYLKFLKYEKLIYHSVDDLTAAPRLPIEQIKAAEKIILELADHIFVTSPTLKVKYEAQISSPVHYFPNVADYDHFHSVLKMQTRTPEDLEKIARPRIGFVGAISSYKVDFDLIEKVSQMRPDWNWVLIGKVGEGDPETDASKLQQPNIHLLGPKEYPQLPLYLKEFDVVVIPCVLNDYTRSMFPMKFFEYLAAEKLIVTTHIPSLCEFKDLYLEANTPTEFVSAISRVLNGEFVYTKKMREAALDNTWERRLQKMLSIITGQKDAGPH